MRITTPHKIKQKLTASDGTKYEYDVWYDLIVIMGSGGRVLHAKMIFTHVIMRLAGENHET